MAIDLSAARFLGRYWQRWLCRLPSGGLERLPASKGSPQGHLWSWCPLQLTLLSAEGSTRYRVPTGQNLVTGHSSQLLYAIRLVHLQCHRLLHHRLDIRIQVFRLRLDKGRSPGMEVNGIRRTAATLRIRGQQVPRQQHPLLPTNRRKVLFILKFSLGPLMVVIGPIIFGFVLIYQDFVQFA